MSENTLTMAETSVLSVRSGGDFAIEVRGDALGQSFDLVADRARLLEDLIADLGVGETA